MCSCSLLLSDRQLNCCEVEVGSLHHFWGVQFVLCRVVAERATSLLTCNDLLDFCSDSETSLQLNHL